MTALDRLVPRPRLVEISRIDLDGSPEAVWTRVRHGRLADSRLIRALFAIRGFFDRREPAGLRIDDLVSSPARPGFQVLVDLPPHEIAVGAIGKVWRPVIPFVHVATAHAFEAFCQPDFVKVAWAVRVTPRPRGAHLEFEVRVDATDEAAWRKFRRYFRVIGVGSRYIRRAALRSFARQFGAARIRRESRWLAGDELLARPNGQATSSIDIAATPEDIWPWLVQMGCGRGGFYSLDRLDNGGVPSAREVRLELQRLQVGEVIPATPGGRDGFEVLRLEAPRALVLGGLYDVARRGQLRFASARPGRYWHATWAFALERLDARSTRLWVRARIAYSPQERLRAIWIRAAHAIMQPVQLRNLAARAEGRLRRRPDHPRHAGRAAA